MDSMEFDVLVAGGGPAGSTAAMTLAKAGHRVCVLEKDSHPRFHIGESILPRTTPLLRELEIEDRVKSLPHTPKYGAEFGFGDDPNTRRFTFNDGLLPGFPVFNVERSHFDKMLLDVARERGAHVVERCAVQSIERLDDGGVRVRTRDGGFAAKVLIDASGHGTVVGRHLGLRRNFTEPALQKVAYFQHFEHVQRAEGEAAGNPTIMMAEEGWFWLIAIGPTKTSVGFVTRPDFVRRISVPPDRLLAWAVARCPVVRDRMRHCTGPGDNHVLSDFSYRCEPYAGPGYFMVGDAACFLDPIFSTGVTLAMVSGHHSAGLIDRVLRGEKSFEWARSRHVGFVKSSTAPFWRLIRAYYEHSFRELFVNGPGPLQMHKAIISILAGQVFPRPAWSLRWRQAAFHLSVALQKRFALAPHREKFRLMECQPEMPGCFELAAV